MTISTEIRDKRVQSRSDDPVQVDLSESVGVCVSAQVDVVVDRKLLHPVRLQHLLFDTDTNTLKNRPRTAWLMMLAVTLSMRGTNFICHNMRNTFYCPHVRTANIRRASPAGDSDSRAGWEQWPAEIPSSGNSARWTSMPWKQKVIIAVCIWQSVQKGSQNQGFLHQDIMKHIRSLAGLHIVEVS